MSRIITDRALRAVRDLVTVIVLAMPTASLAVSAPMSTAAGIAPSGFNWLSNGKTATQQQALAENRALQFAVRGALGYGTWICSPAGFGRKSYCYRN